MSHPLFELSQGKEVRQAAAFRKAAAELAGEALAVAFEKEKAGAPRLHEAGRRYFVKRSGKPAAERRRNRDGEHLGAALIRQCRSSGEGIALPGGEGRLDLLDYHIRVKAAAADDPATKGINRIDLLGISGERLCVVKLRYLEPTATRCGVGDTPLRAMLEGLAYTAIAAANASAIGEEASERFGRRIGDEPPLLVLLASPRYWELCRKREAQKGAAWIKELERLAQDIEQHSGVGVRYASLQLEGDPGWSYDAEGPALDAPARLGAAWESTAGRVRPRARPRSKKPAAAVDEVIQADLSRPVRSYALTESYSPGDRIAHPKLGNGVVQGTAGPGKIRVRFDGKKTLLVHERPV
ncbi:MAG: hypothetical protein OEM49_09185 [Myxococcales bacterium]|nr:hypothetical protein [Myxococcales bacterium]MDH5306956.1 hypothetical protein [Myxococcales bacterium]MDH5566050.1 hypothetical protein [Myxococcales bacterium]